MKKENRLLTIDGETLMSQPLTPLNFVVDTLLSQGLHILAGSPKVGKSWLALWLAVTVAKGESIWGMGVKQGTTLYLCLEDSTLRIQNRLFEITEDAPASVHFSTNSDTLGKGLEEQLRAFLSEHPDTVLIIIDTLQMIRGAGYDNTYANDYRDLSVLKHIADAHGIAILLIHHLRKELADDVFSRISGTTAISGAVDSSFTLVEDKRGSGKAKLSCIGRDIEYRELTLEHNAENVWELVSDSRTQPELLGGRIVILLSELMRDYDEFIGTPTELAERIDPVGTEGITPKKVSRLILQSVAALSKIGISAVVRRSNGKRLIELRRAESDDAQGTQAVDPIDPADVSSGENAPCVGVWAAVCAVRGGGGVCTRRELFTAHGAGRGNRRPLRWRRRRRRRRRQAERPSDKVGRTAEVLRGAAPHPVKGGYYETEKRYQDHSAANAGTVPEHFGKGGCRADDYRGLCPRRRSAAQGRDSGRTKGIYPRT